MHKIRAKKVEWITVLSTLACYGGWAWATAFAAHVDFWAALPAVALAILLTTFHSSLQHECLHGHPTRSAALNEALVFLPLGLFIPYRRFKVLHLRHHRDEALTDPYDDPESWYMAEAGWLRLSRAGQAVFTVNNTLAGRLLIGPLLTLTAFAVSEYALIRRNAPGVRGAWLRHVAGLVPVVAWLVWVCGWSLPVYAVAVAYPALSVLMIRTFAEHQAREDVANRTVIVEKGGLLALLFLNNNLHVVHHAHPAAAWYDLPRLYRADRARYVAENGGYVFSSYLDMARQYLFRTKEPVVHPFLHRQ